MTTLLEDLAINGETVDGETVAAELSSSKPNTVDADADADAADDTSSDTSCEVCRVMSGRYGDGEGEDDWFADETGRKWAGIAEELVGTNRIIFSLKIKTTGTVGLFKETEDLSTGAEGGMRVSLSADGVAYVLDNGELRFQDGHELSFVFRMAMNSLTSSRRSCERMSHGISVVFVFMTSQKKFPR